MYTLTVLTVVTLLFRAWLVEPTELTYWYYYVWVELFGAFLIVQFWAFTNVRFSIPVKPSDSLPSFLAVVCFLTSPLAFPSEDSLDHWNGELALFGRGLLTCVSLGITSITKTALADLKQHKKAAPRKNSPRSGQASNKPSNSCNHGAPNIHRFYLVDSVQVGRRRRHFEKDERTAFLEHLESVAFGRPYSIRAYVT